MSATIDKIQFNSHITLDFAHFEQLYQDKNQDIFVEKYKPIASKRYCKLRFNIKFLIFNINTPFIYLNLSTFVTSKIQYLLIFGKKSY